MRSKSFRPDYHWRRSLAVGLFAATLTVIPAAAQRGGRGGPAAAPLPTSDPQFKFMGPAVGNRIASASGVPGDPTTYYAGAASGGVWKSSDSGKTFAPVFDAQPVMAIGALAVSASNHSIVWAGTGESWAIRDSDMMGDGVYKSTDAGVTWTNMGLKETGRIGRILVNPKDPENVFVCAAGRMTGPQQERGVFKTTDGGKTWTRSLFVDADTGCSGMSMDPNDPNTLLAGAWRVVMHTYAMFSGAPDSEFTAHGPGSGVYLTHDGGATWNRIEGHGMPKPPVGKVDVAIAASNPKRMYALIQTPDQGSIWRSDDGGANWTNGSWQRALIGRAGYYIHLAVNPQDPDEILVTNSSFWLSKDGGKSFNAQNWGGGDTHDIWIDPTDGKRVIITHDGGMNITNDHGGTSNRVTLPIGQMYHVAVDNDVPYHIYGNMQDDGTMRGLSSTQEQGNNVPGQAAPAAGGRGGGGGGRGGAGGAAVGAWDHGLGGCESGFTVPDVTDSNFIWASCYGDEVTTYDYRTKVARSVSPWLHTLDSEPDKAKYRCHWTPPLVIDPFDHKRVYYGCQVIFRTTNGGTHWNVISPDLSHRDPKYIVSSGGIVGDNLGQFYGEVVFAIAPSEVQKDLVWAGTNDGKIWYTTNAGAEGEAKWNDVSANIPGLPGTMGVVSKIEPSHFDAATAYVAIDFHLMDNRAPWLFKTTDFGKTWKKITGDLPAVHPLDYARVISENPNKKGMLFAGTGHALFYSMDDGTHWKQIKGGLPAAPVSWIVVQKQTHDLVVSTYGRGFYIMEDLTPMEQGITPETVTAAVEFLTPKAVVRKVQTGRADWTFVLKEVPKSPVKLEVWDDKGVVRKLPDLTARAGWNRASWDLRYDAPRMVALRTTPTENPHIWEEPRFQGQETRAITHWGVQQGEGAPLAAPGKYTLQMTVDGQVYKEPIEVVRSADAHGTDDDLKASTKLQVKVRDDINAVSDMTNQIEWMRRQLEDQGKTLTGQAGKEALLKSMDTIDKKMQDVEYKLISRAEALSDDKYFQSQYKLFLSLVWLSSEIGGACGGCDVAGAGDYGPTETATGLVLDLEKQLQTVQAEYKSLMDKDVAAYNKSITGSGVNPLPTTGAPPPPLPRGGRGGGGN